jgi:dinuclear metal center YbgI/SA1388 family protein
MAGLQEIADYLDELLEPARFPDHAPNGLQVEGRGRVGRMVGGVTASLALIEAAIAAQADAVLVHHGWFWKNEDPRIRGIKRARLQRLLSADISLFAYHLPLDAHPVHGNNAQLARILDIETEHAGDGAPPAAALLWRGILREPRVPAAFARHIGARLGREPLHIEGRAGRIRRVAWCTGAAQDYIDIAADLGADAYISGEISERTTHIAREAGIHYYAAGHHATERYGVEALGRHLAARFGIEYCFVDIDNPA